MIKINVNPLIEEIFSNFTVSGKVIPISFLNYTGDSDVYLTYYTWFDKPENFYDDEEQHIKVLHVDSTGTATFVVKATAISVLY